MEKSGKTPAGAGSINSTDNNANKDDDSAAHPEEITRAALAELMETERKFRDATEAKQETKRQWRIREKGLRCSNWKLELENSKLRDQTDRRDREILAEVEKNEQYHDEVAKYKSQKQQEAADFWNYFQKETSRYSLSFPNAHIEYSSDCLNADIELHRRNAETLGNKIAKVESQMDSMKTKYGLAELGTSKDARLLQDLDVAKKIISDNSALIRATKSAQDNNDLLELTIKQKKQSIAYLKNKSRKN